MGKLTALALFSVLALHAQYVPPGGGGGGGTATSVGLSMPPTFCSVTNSPVNTTGTLTCTYATGQTANLIFGSNSSGNVGLMNLTSAQLPSIASTLLSDSSSLVRTTDTGSVTNTMLAGSIANGKLSNSSLTIAGHAVSLGGTQTLASSDLSDGTSLATINATVNAQTGTSYTLLSSDNGKVLTFSNGSAITLTVPSGLGSGFNCLIVETGAGNVTPTASSTTINQRQSFTKTAGQYAVATLAAYASNVFVLSGDLQ